MDRRRSENIFAQAEVDPGNPEADDSFDGSSEQQFAVERPMDAESLWHYINERYVARLRLFAELMLGPRLRRRHAVDDLIQETLLKTYKNFSVFEWKGNGSFYRWLCTNLRRTAIDWARRLDAGEQIGSPRAGAEDEQDLIALKPDEGAGPTTAAGSSDLIARIRASLEDPRLPGLYREVLIALIVEGREPREVAAEHEVSADVLRKQKNRGLQIWRGLLEEQGLTPERLL